MKTIILAAGRGERMRPLTDKTPKPLLKVGGKPLIVWHLERLAQAGLTEIIINHAHLGEQLIAALGNGQSWGVRITWSAEPYGALETAGAIAQALPELGTETFLLVNGDIWCDWDFHQATRHLLGPEHPAHLVLYNNPPHHPQGDFQLQGQQVQTSANGPSLTYCGIGLYHPSLFAEIRPGTVMKLRPLLDKAIGCGTVTGEQHYGQWVDVGTPERLAALDYTLSIKNT